MNKKIFNAAKSSKMIYYVIFYSCSKNYFQRLFFRKILFFFVKSIMAGILAGILDGVTETKDKI